MSNFSKKIEACWLGKAIGGTLGMPLEGKLGPHQLSFYEPIPNSLAPNDDLDLQVVWLHHLLSTGQGQLTPGGLADAWRRHVRFPWDEYGCCLRNLEYGLTGMQVGAFDNWFSEGLGAAIRSELWACMAPGDPARAAGFAYCDAVCDHAGDGVWAIVFLSALQSAAFAEHRRDVLLDTALAFLPPESRVRRAVEDTRRWWKEFEGSDDSWLLVREKINRRFGTSNFTDVAANLAYTILGWLAGEEDFGQSLCVAVNCGADTDCTGATLGALLGILNPQGIPEKWSRPIGNTIQLSKGISGVDVPADISDLTERTLRLSRQLSGDTPSIGVVLPRSAPTAGNSPIEVSMRFGWTDDEAFLDAPTQNGAASRQLSEGTDISLAGHWMTRKREDFCRPILLSKKEIVLENDEDLRVMAFTNTRSAVWLDGVKLGEAPFGVGCEDSLAPGFHRGGRGVFQTGLLPRGSHEMLVAWAAPDSGSAELVVGVGNTNSCLWNPFGIANLKA